MPTRRQRPSHHVVQKKEDTKMALSDEFLNIEIERNSTRSALVLSPKPSDRVHRASYFVRIKVTAIKQTVYLPVSVASGRVSTGFVYQVEGTAAGEATARISCRGDGVTMVTLGSILYSKIPLGKTAVYTLEFSIINPSNESYKIVISRINYKLNTNDARYKRFLKEIETDFAKP